MNTLKLASAFIVLLLVSARVMGQENRMYSLYMFNPLVINPAYAGNQNQFSATAVNRSQWVGVDGAPEVQMISAHIGAVKKPIGVGLVVANESIGVHNNAHVNFSYAYQIKGQFFKLAFGLQGGFTFNKSAYGDLTYDIEENIGTIRSFNPNFGFGTFYSTPKFYLGLSVPYVFQNTLASDGYEVTRAPRYYFLHGGRIIKLSKDVVFRPSFLLRYQKGTPVNADISGTMFYKKILSIGASYRTSKTVVILTEFQLNRNFRVGYAYDFMLAGIGPYSGGSHEVMVSYRIDLTPRPCHTYF